MEQNPSTKTQVTELQCGIILNMMYITHVLYMYIFLTLLISPLNIRSIARAFPSSPAGIHDVEHVTNLNGDTDTMLQFLKS